jgi:hypothetical protein
MPEDNKPLHFLRIAGLSWLRNVSLYNTMLYNFYVLNLYNFKPGVWSCSRFWHCFPKSQWNLLDRRLVGTKNQPISDRKQDSNCPCWEWNQLCQVHSQSMYMSGLLSKFTLFFENLISANADGTLLREHVYSYVT